MPKHITESTGASITAEHQFTTGKLLIDPTAELHVDVVSERTAGTGITLDGVLLKDGVIALGTGVSLSVGSGGTGATTAVGARTILGAAASGANTDITSLGGLTTAVSVAQGGTGVTTIPSGELLYGNGTASVQTLSTGTSSYRLQSNAAGLPVWSVPVEYIEVVCNAPSTSNTTTTDIARFHFPFYGYVQSSVCGVSTAPTGTTFAVDVRNGTVSFFSTTMRIDPGEYTSATATTPTVINTATSNFSAWDTCRIHIDSDGIASKGLWVTLTCVRTN